jgi:DNA polymerase alpha subunit B
MATDELQSLFSPNKPLEPDVLSELQSILRLHDLSAEDLFFKWDAYCIKMGTETEAISLSAIRNLKQGIQDSLEKSNNQRHVQVKTERRVQATPRAGAGGGDVFGMLDGLVPSTPASGAKLGKAGSGIKRKMETPAAMSSPAGVSDQLKAMNGLP